MMVVRIEERRTNPIKARIIYNYTI